MCIALGLFVWSSCPFAFSPVDLNAVTNASAAGRNLDVGLESSIMTPEVYAMSTRCPFGNFKEKRMFTPPTGALLFHPEDLTTLSILTSKFIASGVGSTPKSYGDPENDFSVALMLSSCCGVNILQALYLAKSSLAWAAFSSASEARLVALAIWARNLSASLSAPANAACALDAKAVAFWAMTFSSATRFSEIVSSFIAASAAAEPKWYSPNTPPAIANPARIVRAISVPVNSSLFSQRRIVYSTSNPTKTAIVQIPAQWLLLFSVAFNNSTSAVPTGYYFLVMEYRRCLIICFLALLAALVPPVILLSGKRRR